MKRFRGLMIGAAVVAVAGATAAQPQATAGMLRPVLPALVTRVQQAVVNEAEAETRRAAQREAKRVVAQQAEAASSVRLPAPVTVRHGRYQIRIPELCRNSDGRYDVLVHFHGVPDKVEASFAKSGVDAVLVTVNYGIGSGPYENAFSQDGSLARLLSSVDELVYKHCPSEKGGWSRVALSGWSAGYGAIYRVLMNKGDAKLVDSVLLSDGLHAGYTDKFKNGINAAQMAPFVDFASKAAKGEKLFAITHTAIKTDKYASTTETASYLIKEQGLERTNVDEAGPLPKMRLTSTAGMGGFNVRGYAGGDTDAHCDHLFALGDTLFPLLRERWAE